MSIDNPMKYSRYRLLRPTCTKSGTQLYHHQKVDYVEPLEVTYCILYDDANRRNKIEDKHFRVKFYDL